MKSVFSLHRNQTFFKRSAGTLGPVLLETARFCCMQLHSHHNPHACLSLASCNFTDVASCHLRADLTTLTSNLHKRLLFSVVLARTRLLHGGAAEGPLLLCRTLKMYQTSEVLTQGRQSSAVLVSAAPRHLSGNRQNFPWHYPGSPSAIHFRTGRATWTSCHMHPLPLCCGQSASYALPSACAGAGLDRHVLPVWYLVLVTVLI